jgi:hypothetical protein
VASHFAVPGEKYPVRIEVDDPPADGSVDLGFDRSGDEQFAVEKLPGFREQHVYFVPEGPKGGLAFNTIVHDWTRDLDTTGVLGKRQLRVQLSKAGDQEAAVDLVDELDPEELNPKARPDERLPLLTKDKGNPRAPLSYDLASKKAVLATITLDGTPPEDVDFVGWPTKLIRGKPLPLKATGHDDESDISTVTFFLGEPENGKIPPKAVQTKGVLVDAKKAVWLAELPLPTAKPGKFEVSVQFTNGAGLAAEIKTVIIELVDGPKGNPKGGTTVKGKVFQGELTPPDVGVALVDEKGNVKAAGKTNKMGQYVLEGVPPGTYRVVAVRPADGTQGQTAITVPEGKELIDGVDVQISR